MLKILVVAGTRPEAIKLAPVIRKLRSQPELFDCRLLSTGQHREMLAQTLTVFGITADFDLELMRPGQDLTDVTVGALLGLRRVIREFGPDWVLVQGDTTTAFTAALAAFYEKVHIAHVEAGLRTGDRYSPFPEEINRRLTSQLADLHFAPTNAAMQALLAEGHSPDRIKVTGNTVVDAVLWARQLARSHKLTIPGIDFETLATKRVVLVTGHRRESFGEVFEGICRALARIVTENPDVVLVYPVHLNPNVREPVFRMLGGRDRIHLIRPLGYLDFVSMIERSHLILTDSGGIQEEAPSFNKPILVMRDVTERPEGIEVGVARLVGTSEERIAATTSALLRDDIAYSAMAKGPNPYGDGRASERISELLLRFSGSREQGAMP